MVCLTIMGYFKLYLKNDNLSKYCGDNLTLRSSNITNCPVKPINLPNKDLNRVLRCIGEEPKKFQGQKCGRFVIYQLQTQFYL